MRSCPRKPRARKQRLEILDIAADPRSDVGIEDGRRGALVFAIFAQDFVGKRTIDGGSFLAQQCPRLHFMLRIGPGVNETDGDRFDIRFAHATGCFPDAGELQGNDDFARRIQPLDEFEGEVARHIGFRPLEMEIVGLRTAAAADPVDVAHALRGEQGGARPRALDRRIDGDCRAVDESVGSLDRQQYTN